MPPEHGLLRWASGRPVVDRGLPGGGWPDFALFPQHAAQSACGQQRLLDVLVAGAFLKEDDHFAIWALPGIAGLQPLRPVAKRRFASRAMNLNGIGHFWLSMHRERLATQAPAWLNACRIALLLDSLSNTIPVLQWARYGGAR